MENEFPAFRQEFQVQQASSVFPDQFNTVPEGVFYLREPAEAHVRNLRRKAPDQRFRLLRVETREHVEEVE